MKKTVIAAFGLLTLFSGSFNAFALDAEECGKAHGKFTNLSFVSSNMKQENYPKLKSDYGFALTKGNTYYLHRPIAGLLRFGIDAVWTDITYANYKVNEHYNYNFSNPAYDHVYTESYSINEIDVAMAVGASATVNLFKYLQASAYFRYNPTFQMMINDGVFQGGFANMFTTGGNVSYGRFGLGLEARFGSSKTKAYIDTNDLVPESTNAGKKFKTNFSGLRAYVIFRF